MKLTEYDIKEHSLGKINPANSEIAMSFVRFHRTGLLRQSDWMSGTDVNMTDE